MQATVASIPAERRVRPRHEYWVVVRFTHAGVQHVGMSVDVSLGGMCLRSDTVGFEVGLRLLLEFDVPLLRNPVAVQAELRWVDEARGVCGVQFITGLRAREVWAIQQLVLPSTLL